MDKLRIQCAPTHPATPKRTNDGSERIEADWIHAMGQAAGADAGAGAEFPQVMRRPRCPCRPDRAGSSASNQSVTESPWDRARDADLIDEAPA